MPVLSAIALSLLLLSGQVVAAAHAHGIGDTEQCTLCTAKDVDAVIPANETSTAITFRETAGHAFAACRSICRAFSAYTIRAPPSP